jgi:uroporphyrinogen-III decarboxylase
MPAVADTPRLYQERAERIRRAMALEPVDRLPVIYMGTAFAPRYVGMSIARFCADPEARVEATLAAMERLGDLDGINAAPAGRITPALTRMWLSRVAVPGRDLPDDSLWQVEESEVMTVEDYDAIVEEGWPAFLKRYLPRVIDPAEIDANRAWIRANLAGVLARFRAAGFVPLCCGATAIPFEYLCGGRSMQEFFLDLHRRPELVKAAMDAMQPTLIAEGIAAARASGIPAVWVGGWRSASGLLSPRLWNAAVFPYLSEMVGALAREGIVSVLHFDQDWTRDLARLRELPARQCVLNLDGMTDIRRAKALLGDHMALMGEVPAALLSAGTPGEVERYVRDLARDCGPTGLLLCAGCDTPLDALPENVEAFVATASSL